MSVFIGMKQGQRGSLVFGAALLAFLAVLPSAARAQSNEQLLNRMSQMENQIQTLSRSVYRGDAPPPSAISSVSSEALPSAGSVAGYEMRIADLETQVRSLTGQVEKQTYDIEQMKTRLEKALADNEMRFAQIERGGAQTSPQPAPSGYAQPYSGSGGAAPTTLSRDEMRGYPPAPTVIPSPTVTQTAPEQLYESAFALVREGRYDQAEKSFQSFLDRYSDHALAANAQYWLSETFYVRGDYDRSAKMFAQGYQKYPKSPKAADNLLKMGLSLAKLGKKDDACLSFSQMQRQFAGDTGPVMRRVVQEKKTLGCE